MIYVLDDIAPLIALWAIGLTLVYGVCESSFPLLRAARVVISSLNAEGWWGEVLVYCPYCIGFWIHGSLGLLYELSVMSFVRQAAIWIASLLLLRVVFNRSLVRSAYEDELDLIDDIRKRTAT